MMRYFLFALALLLGSSAFAQAPGPPGPAMTPVGTGASGQALPMLQSTALEASHIFKTSGGNLYSLDVVNTGAAGFILLIDGNSVPADGPLTSCGTTNPAGCLKACFGVAVGTPTAPVSALLLQLQPGPPVSFANGIVAVFSTTGCNSKTIGTAITFFEAQIY